MRIYCILCDIFITFPLRSGRFWRDQGFGIVSYSSAHFCASSNHALWLMSVIIPASRPLPKWMWTVPLQPRPIKERKPPPSGISAGLTALVPHSLSSSLAFWIQRSGIKVQFVTTRNKTRSLADGKARRESRAGRQAPDDWKRSLLYINDDYPYCYPHPRRTGGDENLRRKTFPVAGCSLELFA